MLTLFASRSASIVALKFEPPAARTQSVTNFMDEAMGGTGGQRRCVAVWKSRERTTADPEPVLL